MNKLLLTLFAILVFAILVDAQDNTDFGVWNDIQVSHTLTKQVDVIGAVRFDTKTNTSKFAEQRIYGGINWKSKNGRFTVQPWLMFLRNFAKKPYYELRPQVALGYKFTTPSKINISPKVRIEYHNKINVKNDGRIVPLVTFDKKVSKNYSLFNTDEFWISLYNPKDVAKNRKRLFFGVTRVFNKNLSLDIFYLYQRDELVAPRNTHKLGFTWKIKLDKAPKKLLEDPYNTVPKKIIK